MKARGAYRFESCPDYKIKDMKQTAVEWLISIIERYVENLDEDHLQNLDDLFEQAKEIEKDQIINAYIEASENFDDITKEIAEHFYRETYGK